MSIFHFDSVHQTSPINPPSEVSDAILIEHVLNDPETVPGLERQFGPELLAMTTEVAKAALLEQLDKSFPLAVRIENDYREGNLVISRDFTTSDPDATSYGEKSDPIANIEDTLIAPVTAQVPPRPFTKKESVVVDTALRIVIAQGRQPQEPITNPDPDTVGSDTSIMISGATARPGYREEALDMLNRRIQSRTLRHRVANVISRIPLLARVA